MLEKAFPLGKISSILHTAAVESGLMVRFLAFALLDIWK